MSDAPSVLQQRSIRALVWVTLALAAANAINVLAGKPVWPVTRTIDLGSDTNPSAWYSSMLLAFGALAAVDAALVAGRRGIAPWPLYMLAALLALMSCDEIARLHETLGGDLAKLAGVAGLSFSKHAAWVWVGGPVIAAIFVGVAWAARRTFLRVPGSFGRLALGFVLVFAGGVVLESSINFLDVQGQRLLWDLEIIVEETLEMIGSLVMASAVVLWRDASGAGADATPRP